MENPMPDELVKNRLKEVVEYLPYGYAALLSQIGYSRSMVAKVARGHRYNRDIAMRLIELAKEEQQKLESI